MTKSITAKRLIAKLRKWVKPKNGVLPVSYGPDFDREDRQYSQREKRKRLLRKSPNDIGLK